MVKILFEGDTHLDIDEPHAIMRQRQDEFQRIFQQIIDFALKQEVDLICHLGDLFHTRKPSPTTVQFVIQQLYRLQEKGIKFYLIRGNHEGATDLDDLFTGWAGEYVKIPDMPAIELIDPKFDEARRIPTYGYRDFSESLRVYGIGYYRRETMAVIKHYIPLEKIDPTKFNILLMHGFIETVNDSYALSKSEPILPVDEIAGLNFPLIGVGHGHNQVIPMKVLNSLIFAPGSPIDWRFDHLGSHGFYLVDVNTETRETQFQWHEIEPKYAMKYITIDGKATPRHKTWFEGQLDLEFQKLLKSTQKKIILGVRLKGNYTDDSPRFQGQGLRDAIHALLKDQLLFLGPVSLKGLQYVSKSETEIKKVQETKLDEEEILAILQKQVEEPVAQLCLNLYKKIDETFMDASKLTDKKGDLKGSMKKSLQALVREQLETYYRTGATEKDLEKIRITEELVVPSSGTSKKEASPAKAVKKPSKKKSVKGIDKYL